MAELIGQLMSNTNVAHDVMSLSGNLYKSIGSVLTILKDSGDMIY